MAGAYRFSPSPTGKLHLGSARTAMVSYVLSKQAEAEFHLRIEDTDLVRSTKAFEDEIIESIQWLGVQFNNAVIRQSEQEEAGVYKDIGKKLVDAGLAYYCGCTKHSLQKMKAAQIQAKLPLGYTGVCREANHSSGALRLNMAAVRLALDSKGEYGGLKHIKFTDSVYGPRNTDLRDLTDIVLLRANGEATYLLANTVDDLFSGVTRVVRGADILPQTPIQIVLRQSIATTLSMPIDIPEYTHVPLVLGESGEKLSKRSPTTKSIMDFKADGILPDAITQFALAIGNSSITKTEALTLQEIIECYDASKNAKNNVAFSVHQLLFINKLHIRRTPNDVLNKLMGTSFSEETLQICKHRVNTLVALKADAEAAEFIIKTFEKELKDLESKGFPPKECQDFRVTCLGGASGIALNALKFS